MDNGNVARVRGVYEAFAAGDIPAVLGAMSPAMVWNEAENFPYADGNPYQGSDAILDGVFMRLATEWEGFRASPDTFLDAGDHVVALGRYTGVLRATGKAMDAQFAHVWRLEDGRTVSFQQYTDTLQAAETARA